MQRLRHATLLVSSNGQSPTAGSGLPLRALRRAGRRLYGRCRQIDADWLWPLRAQPTRSFVSRFSFFSVSINARNTSFIRL